MWALQCCLIWQPGELHRFWKLQLRTLTALSAASHSNLHMRFAVLAVPTALRAASHLLQLTVMNILVCVLLVDSPERCITFANTGISFAVFACLTAMNAASQLNYSYVLCRRPLELHRIRNYCYELYSNFLFESTALHHTRTWKLWTLRGTALKITDMNFAVCASLTAHSAASHSKFIYELCRVCLFDSLGHCVALGITSVTITVFSCLTALRAASHSRLQL